MPKKKELNYKKIAVSKQNVNANIGTLAKQAGVKPSDFKNRKAYLNYISRKAGFSNYNQWQKARRQAELPKGRGGRKKKINKFDYTYTIKKLKNYIIEMPKVNDYFLKVNKEKEKELKYFTIELKNIEKPIKENSHIMTEINRLLDWLDFTLSQIYDKKMYFQKGMASNENESVDITLHFEKQISNEMQIEEIEHPEDIF